MIKKPDVLSNEEIFKVECGYEPRSEHIEIGINKFINPLSLMIAKAQLDVCVKHYEPLIKEMYEALKELVGWLDDDEMMIGNVVTIKANCYKVLAKAEA